jgi:tight adherence protein C
MSPLRGRRERRRQAVIDRTLPDAIEVTIIAIRAGLTPASALRAAAVHASDPVRVAFDEVEHRQRRGRRFADALDAIPELLGPGAADLADSLATADRYGLPLEPVLERLAVGVRDDRRRLAEQCAKELPVRLSFPLVACTLPSFVLLAIVPAVLGAVSTLRGSAP